MVEQGMRDCNIPGLSLGIVKGDKLVYLKGYGTADNSGRLVTPQTPFILGSVSKSFTALAIMQLVEQGKIELDTDVQHYLPWLRLDDPGGVRQVTVRDLLNQTSGISTYEGREILNAGNQSLEKVVREQSNLMLAKPVGTTFQYSNTNYIILGEIVQRVSGFSYEQYIEEHIFIPLDMKNSFSVRLEALRNGLASGYQSVFGRMTSTNPRFQQANVPAGYLISSAEDMTHYLVAQISGGKYQNTSLLSLEGMREMHQRSAVFPYGMGWFTDPQMISHGGDTENFHSDVIILIESGWGLVVLMNTNDALKTKLYGNVYQQLSYNLINLVSDGELFYWGTLAPTKFGDIDLYINILIIVVVLWILWSIYSPTNRKPRFKGTSVGFILITLANIFIYFVIPLVVLLQVPRRLMAPWRTILNYVPGAGHALLFLPITLLLIGLIKMLLRVRQIRGFIHRGWTE
ncbi:serine hydrolase domain-containing protein [Paenibacillus sp. HB172176]|uniref:serine hydrolase domain-containing protein n=1 Tax=Paenibacillus sp. HB172176 TaxID=2493690 RepID=UPI00143B10CB|nr:serine hydrolase domain-containing protein [Paenibacillus sp. HB172176]